MWRILNASELQSTQMESYNPKLLRNLLICALVSFACPFSFFPYALFSPTFLSFLSFSSQSRSWRDGDIGLEVHGDLSPTLGGRGLSLPGLGSVPLPGSSKKTAQAVLVVRRNSAVTTLTVLLCSSLSYSSQRRSSPKPSLDTAVESYSAGQTREFQDRFHRGDATHLCWWGWGEFYKI